MERSLREKFNNNFTEEKYKAYMEKVEGIHPGALDFRNAETPLFIPKDFTKKMLGACEDIIDVITAPNFKKLTERSIPADVRVPGDEKHAEFIVFDFGICEDGQGGYEPQLIEMQGFLRFTAFRPFTASLQQNTRTFPKLTHLTSMATIKNRTSNC